MQHQSGETMLDHLAGAFGAGKQADKVGGRLPAAALRLQSLTMLQPPRRAGATLARVMLYLRHW